MADSTQPMNLARIVHRLLTNPRGWDRDALMEDLGIADRTYRKYRKNLEDLFEPWFQDGETRLEEIQEGERRFLRLREPNASNGEVMGLLQRLSAFQLAGQLFEFLGGEEFGTALADQAQRVGREGRRTHPGTFSRLMGHLDRLFVHVPDAPKDYVGQEDKLRILINALVYQREVRFDYDASNGERREHSVEPLTLAMFKGGLYLLARYPGKDKSYKFVVDRLHGPEAVEDGYFCYPSPAEYDPKALHEGVLGIFVEKDAKSHDVELVFPDVKWLKYYLREREWQKGQRINDLPDGRLRLRFTVTSLVEVVPFVLQFGHEVEVLGPTELQKAVTSARGA
jgi:predicted DNA-binding transcriptional regulator YafY